jgi:hypothetical protein
MMKTRRKCKSCGQFKWFTIPKTEGGTKKLEYSLCQRCRNRLTMFKQRNPWLFKKKRLSKSKSIV